MYIKKAGSPDYEGLVKAYIAELTEAGIPKCKEEKFRQKIIKTLQGENGMDAYVAVEDGKIVAVCYCSIITMLPLPDKPTKYYVITDLYTLPAYRHVDYEGQLVKYVKCEMFRGKILEYKF